MEFASDIEIVELDSFDAAFVVAPQDEQAVRQRFMTLFVNCDQPELRGGSAQIRKARNIAGETFALKSMRTHVSGTASASSGSSTRRKVLRSSVHSLGSAEGSPIPDYITKGHVAAFYEEYRMHAAVAQLRGFPKLYGFGLVDDSPVIVMEWVEGTTLRDATRTGAFKRGSTPLELVARVGLGVLEMLQRAQELSKGFVHRDLSARNIMLRTDKVPLEEQLAGTPLDLCLVDFGSASFATLDDGLTMEAGVWRKGTPAYAPPEMLTSDVELPEGYRHSEKIDTYALCSVLYELYAGTAPFGSFVYAEDSPYRTKTETAPSALDARPPDGGALAELIVAGLAAPQEDRPTVAQLKAALENWLDDPSQAHAGLPKQPGKRTGIWQPGSARQAMTRRKFIAAGIVGIAGVASAGIAGVKLLRSANGVDPSRYEQAGELYAGEPLYRALDANSANWMLVSKDGRITCQPVSNRPCGALREGACGLYDDLSQLYGFITPASTADGYGWVVLPAFARVGDFAAVNIGNAGDGLALAAAQDRDSKLWGFVDRRGAWALQPQFSDARAFSNGAAAVRANDAGGLWGAIDANGQWAVQPMFAELGMQAEDGCAVAQSPAGEWGIVGPDGAWLTKQTPARLRRYANGCAPALDPDTGTWGFVDAEGNWVIDAKFKDARPFSEGVAAVQDAKTQLWYFIDPDGTAHDAMKPKLWKLGELVDGLAPAQASASDSTVVFDADDEDAKVENVGKRYGYVNAIGQWQMKRLTTLVDTAIDAPGL